MWIFEERFGNCSCLGGLPEVAIGLVRQRRILVEQVVHPQPDAGAIQWTVIVESIGDRGVDGQHVIDAVEVRVRIIRHKRHVAADAGVPYFTDVAGEK